MAYTQEDKDRIFNEIISDIESGLSLRASLRKDNRPSSSTFFIWIDEDELKSKQYARSTELRADILFDEILEIAYTTEEGTTTKETDKGIEISTGDMLGHRRLKVDSLKWVLSKMNPKKYGDKTDITSGGEKLPTSPQAIQIEITKPDEN